MNGFGEIVFKKLNFYKKMYGSLTFFATKQFRSIR